VNYGMAYTFKYSARPGTPAADRPQMPSEVLDDRLQRLQTLITAQQRAAQQAMVGQEATVLFEKSGRLPGQLVGKSQHLHAVHAVAPIGTVGQVQRVRITTAEANSLGGVVVGAD
jgi:tRNA-2-methylthio-N6-dimethylallyladenosine synthase